MNSKKLVLFFALILVELMLVANVGAMKCYQKVVSPSDPTAPPAPTKCPLFVTVSCKTHSFRQGTYNCITNIGSAETSTDSVLRLYGKTKQTMAKLKLGLIFE